MTLIYDTTRAGGGYLPGRAGGVVPGGGGVLQILPKITQTQNVPAKIRFLKMDNSGVIYVSIAFHSHIIRKNRLKMSELSKTAQKSLFLPQSLYFFILIEAP